MKKILLLALILMVGNAMAIELTDSTKKVSVRLVGRIDAVAFTDSYRSVESGNGLQYLFPARPSFDRWGADGNRDQSLRFGISSTRLGLGVGSKLTGKVAVGAYVEADLLGPSNNNVVGSVRLRHAYFNVNIGRSSILIGQTSHLMHVDEQAPPTVTFGAGYPFNVLSRPIQFRFTQRLGQRWSVAAAASMFHGHIASMQSAAMTPDISARVMYVAPNGSMVGASGGFQSLAPQMDAMNENARMNAGYGTIFAQWNFAKGYAFRGAVAYGGNMDALGFTGGFAPTATHDSYRALNTVSGWLDLETVSYCGFQFGVFGGYQKNMGANTEIAKNEIVVAQDQLGLDSFWRVAPRMWYHYKMVGFGVEYMYTNASWAHSWDNNYRATSILAPVGNHRVTLLARFNF